MSEPSNYDWKPGSGEMLHKQAQPHSVELSLTAAGKISGSVKVYDADENVALERAEHILIKILQKFPPKP